MSGDLAAAVSPPTAGDAEATGAPSRRVEVQRVCRQLQLAGVELIAPCYRGTAVGGGAPLGIDAGVVLASEGYPGVYSRRKPISGLDSAGELEDVVVFHSGTAQAPGRIVTNGGRVLGVTALGEDVSAARDLAYRAAGMIDYNGAYYRKDIAQQTIS